jgi:hypothetical protein
MRAEDSAKWLRRIRWRQKEIAVLKERVSTLDGMMRGLDYSMPRVAAPPNLDAIPDYVIALEEAKTRYADLVEEYAQEVRECHDAIYRLENPLHRMVLEMYYLDCKSWREVSRELNYSEEYLWEVSLAARELLWWHIPLEWRTT